MPETEELPARLHTVLARLTRHLRQTRAGAELTTTQYQVLASVFRHGPMRHSDLAAHEGLNPTMLSRIVTKLETAGLVVRAPDVADGRAARLSVSDRGRDLVERVKRERNDALSMALDRLGNDDLVALTGALPVLESLAEALREKPR
jgi:DNA-binding MarR family transcriptional regulator